ncbi:hypothetical protein IDJ77_11315 [Mucilaginibacter sp. ZT4R22]|uniref:Uncharacterized protein n=1 Tax=Mucilaginibacter pankratovii TaxID=2772110 RepID=A0ABR7WQF8_9SPHI|nr:hypothetical protein [Mucilaginibacter pankratovii]MBD1364398.1 hypothetical protein [Mucilaginibacter pankratovii]
MPTYSKIPIAQKKIGRYDFGGYSVFCKSFALATQITQALFKADTSRGIPGYGYLILKGKKYYYSRYGFADDPDTYTKAKSKAKTKRK